jgi:lipopolysaccharide/colanic/teichoic acid biosynthesis glycosyltransferase
VLSFLWRDLDLSRLWLILSWAFLLVFMWVGRMIFRRLGYWLRRHGWLTAQVLMVGANDQGIAMATQWQHTAASGMRVVGFVDDFKPVGTTVFDDIQVIGRPTSLLELVRQTGAQEVVVVPNSVAWETLQELVTRSNAGTANGFTLRLSPGYYEFLTTGVAVTNKTFVPLFTINEARIVGMDSIYKVVFDYGLGLMLSILTLPISLALVVFLKLTALRKPVLARYQASGQGGKLFTMLKFNLEAGNASEQQSPEKLKRLRNWLYGRGLDKLPQLLNVLAGQMSVVGPRPRVFDHSQPDTSQARTLTTVKPGIIGPWIVGELWTTPDELHDEMYYVRNWTIWLDVQILVQSALAFLGTHRPARRVERVEPGDRNKRSRRVVSKVTFEADSLPLYPVGRRGMWQTDGKEDNSRSDNRYAA